MSARRKTTRKTATRRRAGRSTHEKRAAGQPSNAPGAVPASQLLRPERRNELIVRMYRQGLGDCFLLALPAKNDGVKYVLIDCGVHARQTDGPARLTQVMNHLVASTGSHIDIVVATHEHADHLSGFVQKDSPFLSDDLKIDQLWVAWTERRGDSQADRLRRKRGTAQRVIDKAVEEARQRAGVDGGALADRLLDLTDFNRPASGSVDLDALDRKIDELKEKAPIVVAANEVPGLDDAEPDETRTMAAVTKKGPGKKKKKRPSSNELALALLALKAGGNNTAFCEPGEVMEIDGVGNLRAYVLGPPRSELLQKDKPSKIRGADERTPGGRYKEVYLTAAAANRTLELSPRLQPGTMRADDPRPNEFRHPFASPFSRECDLSAPPGVRRGRRWTKEAPPPATRAIIEDRYLDSSSSWRRVDGDWLTCAETLALNLVEDTNNTSLVLAFEWGDAGSGTVLLFAADAQVGNWLSWRDQTYGSKKQKADDLLKRALLYKVGHHGSHNATVRRDPRDPSSPDPIGAPFGLELMNDIIAMIPVDWDAAKKKMPDPWKMPHEPLYRRLREKAGRRIMRSDLQLTPLDEAREQEDLVPKTDDWQPVPGLKDVRWRMAPASDTFGTGTEGPLYYDVAIPLPA